MVLYWALSSAFFATQTAAFFVRQKPLSLSVSLSLSIVQLVTTMGAIKTLLLHSQAKFHQPRFPNQSLHSSFKPPRTNLTLCSHKPHSLMLQHTKLHISESLAHLSHPHIPYTQPTSNLSKPSLSPQNTLSNFLLEKTLALVVGSFILMGCFNARPSLAALPGRVTSSSTNSEGNQNVESEEEVMFEMLLKKEPRNVEVLKVVVYGKMRRGKHKEALEYVVRLIDIEPGEVEWRLLQALCYEMMGQLNRAQKLFEEILEKNPLLLKALHGLAMVMHKNEEGLAVFEMLAKALDVARHEKKVMEERNIRILIAQIHVVQGQLEEGLRKLQELVNENPRDFRPYLCQGIIYSLQNEKQKAAEQFEIYSSLVPEEFPQRGFLDDVVFAATTRPQEELKQEFENEFSTRR